VEIRLTILIVLVAIVLVGNTMLLWVLHRRLSSSFTKAEGMEGPMTSLIGALRNTIARLEVASGRATESSASARQRIGDFGGDLDRVQDWFHFGLAKVDFEMDRIFGSIQEGTDKVKSTVSEPLLKAGSICQGIRAVLDLVTISRGDDPTR